MSVDDLRAELVALAELLASDHRARTQENYRRRDALRRRIGRCLVAGAPEGTRRHNVTDSTRTCIAPGCGRAIPATIGGRKVRSDRVTCSDACRQALARARRTTS